MNFRRVTGAIYGKFIDTSRQNQLTLNFVAGCAKTVLDIHIIDIDHHLKVLELTD